MRAALLWSLVPLAILLPGTAQARARDDVMAAAFRCVGIDNARTWLDCYYGAAQPMRAQLGLPPAPANQVRLSQAPPSGGAPADAERRNEIMIASSRCYGIAEDRPWLDCYYAAAQTVRTQLGLAPLPPAHALPAPGPATAMPANPPLAPLPNRADTVNAAGMERQFGMQAAPGARQIVAPLTSYGFDHNAMFTVTLANGQQWRQLAGDTSNAHWKKPAGNYTAKITHGAFGSFNLQIVGLPGLYKVERLQ